MKKLIVMMSALLILMSFYSCSALSGEGDFFAGEPVSPDELRRYSEEFSDTGTTAELPNELPKGKIVYWTSGGSVYHLYRECGHISSGKEVEVGTVGMAEKAGIGRFCRTCAKKYAEEVTES